MERSNGALANAMRELCYLIEANKDIQQHINATLSTTDAEILQKWIPLGVQTTRESAVMQDLPTQHSFQCFLDSLRSFLAIVCSQVTLVLVLDDCQWIDEASQQVLDFLLSDATSGMLLLVASRQPQTTISTAAWPHKTISLGPLSESNVNEIMAHMLQVRSEVIKGLSSVIYTKTAGNPYYCIQFLESLHSRNLVSFHFAKGTWEWKVEDIVTHTNVSSNVVGLLMEKIQSLSTDVQVMLATAASLGFTFNADILHDIVVTHSFSTDIYEALETAKDGESKTMGYAPLTNLNRLLETAVQSGLIETASDSISSQHYKFSHDRIQQCSLDMFPASLCPKLGMLVFEMSQRHEGCQEEWMIYTCVDLLLSKNAAAHMISFFSNRDFARLCLDAARIASKRCAYISAAEYADKGLSLVTWQDDYDLRLELSNLSTDMRYAYGNFERSRVIISDIFENARVVSDKLRAFTVYVSMLGANQDLTGARLAATKFLREIGVNVPKKANTVQVALAVAKTKRMLNGRKPADLKDLVVMTDRTIVEAMRLLFRLTLYDWRTSQSNLLAIHSMTMLQLTLRHGMGPIGPVATALYGVVVSHMGNLEEAFEWCQLTIELVEDPMAEEGYSHAIKVAHLCLHHLKKPLFESIDPMLEAFQVAKRLGDMEIAAYCLQGHGMFSVVVGMPLGNLEQELRGYVDYCRQFRQEAVLMEVLPFYQLTLNLLGRSKDPLILSGDAMVEFDFVNTVYRSNEGDGSVLLLRYARIFLLYILGELDLAEQERLAMERHCDFVSTYFMKYLNCFFCGMTCLGMAQHDKKSARKHARNAKPYVKQLERIASAGSPNFVPMLRLLKAEEQALKGSDSMQEYDACIAMSSRSGFRLITAVACERAGGCMLERGESELASDYLRRSWDLFSEYGAVCKLEQMERTYKSTLNFRRKASELTGSCRSSTRFQPHQVESWKQRVGQSSTRSIDSTNRASS